MPLGNSARERRMRRARRARARAARRRRVFSNPRTDRPRTEAGTSVHTAAIPSMSAAVASAQLSAERTTTIRSAEIPLSHADSGENHPADRGSTQASGPGIAASWLTATWVIPEPGSPTNPNNWPGPHKLEMSNSPVCGWTSVSPYSLSRRARSSCSSADLPSKWPSDLSSEWPDLPAPCWPFCCWTVCCRIACCCRLSSVLADSHCIEHMFDCQMAYLLLSPSRMGSLWCGSLGPVGLRRESSLCPAKGLKPLAYAMSG